VFANACHDAAARYNTRQRRRTLLTLGVRESAFLRFALPKPLYVLWPF
jgi:hypothetical protein